MDLSERTHTHTHTRSSYYPDLDDRRLGRERELADGEPERAHQPRPDGGHGATWVQSSRDHRFLDFPGLSRFLRSFWEQGKLYFLGYLGMPDLSGTILDFSGST